LENSTQSEIVMLQNFFVQLYFILMKTGGFGQLKASDWHFWD